MDLTREEKDHLLFIARESISSAFRQDTVEVVTAENPTGNLAACCGNFVTLNRHGKLRGCIGTITTATPLARSVAANARKAAFSDTRFSPLTESEFSDVGIEISVLTPPRNLEVSSHDDLLERLQPGVDGLIVEDAGHRATFLPQVWDKLPKPGQFVAQLFLKAGLPPGYWSRELRFSTYRALKF